MRIIVHMFLMSVEKSRLVLVVADGEMILRLLWFIYVVEVGLLCDLMKLHLCGEIQGLIKLIR